MPITAFQYRARSVQLHTSIPIQYGTFNAIAGSHYDIANPAQRNLDQPNTTQPIAAQTSPAAQPNPA